MRGFPKFAPLGVVMLTLGGCDGPSPGFRGADATRIKVGQSTFDVRVMGNRAEAVRVNREWAPHLDAVAPRALPAIEQVSGCRVTKLGGDQALIKARLRCGKGRNPAPQLPRHVMYDCDIEETYVSRQTGEKTTELTCQRRGF